MSAQEQIEPILSQGILLGVAEEIKLPLLQIRQLAELNLLLSNVEQISQIDAIANAAVKLIDNYILGVKLALDPQPIKSESVSIASILYDSKEELKDLASNYKVDLALNLSGKYGPVTTNRAGLQAALVSLGSALIEALPANTKNEQITLQFAMHRSRYGIVAGVYSDTKQISQTSLQSARKLQKVSRQPFVNLSHTAGVGIFVADTILRSMNLQLKTSRHKNWYGLATILQPNGQLSLIV